jgi:hypothetical protein
MTNARVANHDVQCEFFTGRQPRQLKLDEVEVFRKSKRNPPGLDRPAVALVALHPWTCEAFCHEQLSKSLSIGSKAARFTRVGIRDTKGRLLSAVRGFLPGG